MSFCKTSEEKTNIYGQKICTICGNKDNGIVGYSGNASGIKHAFCYVCSDLIDLMYRFPKEKKLCEKWITDYNARKIRENQEAK